MAGRAQTAPAITQQPGNQNVATGTVATFTVAASGSPTPDLQWQRLPVGSGTWGNVIEGGAYAGSQSGTLQVAAMYSMAGDRFRCVATNPVDTVTSNPATLIVRGSALAITAQPADQSVRAGAMAGFSVVTTGDPAPSLRFWQRLPFGSSAWTTIHDGAAYGGTSTATLTINPATLAMSGDQFRFIATSPTSSIQSTAAILTVTAAATCDFNADGKADLVWQNTASGVIGFWLMNGTAFSSWVDAGIVSTDWRIAATADFNGDGQPDVLWENTVTGDRGVWLMNGTTFASWVDLGIMSTDWHIAAAADFNLDGKTDILWENRVTGDRGFWLMDGATFSSWVDVGVISTALKIVATADFNGDGQTDIVWENTSTGKRVIWFMNGTTFNSSFNLGIVGTEWHIAAAADLNADGQPDILWENTITGDRGFWLMNGTAFSSWVDIGIVSSDWRIAN